MTSVLHIEIGKEKKIELNMLMRQSFIHISYVKQVFWIEFVELYRKPDEMCILCSSKVAILIR